METWAACIDLLTAEKRQIRFHEDGRRGFPFFLFFRGIVLCPIKKTHRESCHRVAEIQEHPFTHQYVLEDVYTDAYFFGEVLFMKRKTIQAWIRYFSKTELILWFLSVIFIVVSFGIFDRQNYLTLTASLIGATSLIFNAKGNPFGQLLMIVFSILYGIISLGFRYYGEMITYLGMTAPMAVFSFVSWLKNPYNGNRAEVAVNRLTNKERLWMCLMTACITFIFYFILRAFHTTNLILSTISVATSFWAVSLTFQRSAFFAIGYAANDLVLIGLWILATVSDISYLSVVICFLIFFVNDIYGFLNWRKMYMRQQGNHNGQINQL